MADIVADNKVRITFDYPISENERETKEVEVDFFVGQTAIKGSSGELGEGETIVLGLGTKMDVADLLRHLLHTVDGCL